MTRDAVKVLCKFVSEKRFGIVFFGDGRNMGSVVLGVHVGADLFAGQRLFWLSEGRSKH